MPTISIALCTYNGAKFLREQIESILGQTWTSLELVASDDGSCDATRSILNDYGARDSRVRILRDDSLNRGINRNFERAIRACSGDYIAPADQDDIWHPSKLEQLVPLLDSKDLAYSDSRFVNEYGHPVGGCISDHLTMFEGQTYSAFVDRNCVSGHAMLIRREALGAMLPFPQGIYYDQWIAFHAARRRGIAYLPEVLVSFRQHAGSVTNLTRVGSAATPVIQPTIRGSRAIRRSMESIRLMRRLTPFIDSIGASPYGEVLRTYRALLAANLVNFQCAWSYRKYRMAYQSFLRAESAGPVFPPVPRLPMTIGRRASAILRRRHRCTSSEFKVMRNMIEVDDPAEDPWA